jgi:hypothetical protein
MCHTLTSDNSSSVGGKLTSAESTSAPTSGSGAAAEPVAGQLLVNSPSAVGEDILKPGLPDGLFSYQKIRIFMHFGMPLSGKFWYIVLSFGKFYCHMIYFCDHLVYVLCCLVFPRFGILRQEKSGKPGISQGCQILLTQYAKPGKICQIVTT